MTICCASLHVMSASSSHFHLSLSYNRSSPFSTSGKKRKPAWGKNESRSGNVKEGRFCPFFAKPALYFRKKLLLFSPVSDKIMFADYWKPACRNGRRGGLKIHWWRHRAGSSPAAGIRIFCPELHGSGLFCDTKRACSR